MGDLMKFFIPFLYIPKNYDESLKRLGIFAFWELLIIFYCFHNTLIFGHFNKLIHIWEISNGIKQMPILISVINPPVIISAFLFAILSYVFQIHDRISDLLKIRINFDVNNILIPLAKKVGVQGIEAKKTKIILRRDTLMRSVFYKYASSRMDNPLVDKHDIEHAMAAWSWFWVFEEATAYFLIAAFAACVIDMYFTAIWFLIGAIILLILAFLQYPRLKRYARPQIDAIARDPKASQFVKQEFDAL